MSWWLPPESYNVYAYLLNRQGRTSSDMAESSRLQGGESGPNWFSCTLFEFLLLFFFSLKQDLLQPRLALNSTSILRVKITGLWYQAWQSFWMSKVSQFSLLNSSWEIFKMKIYKSNYKLPAFRKMTSNVVTLLFRFSVIWV